MVVKTRAQVRKPPKRPKNWSSEGRIITEVDIQVFGSDYEIPMEYWRGVVHASANRPTRQPIGVESESGGAPRDELRLVNLGPGTAAAYEEKPPIEGIADPAACGSVPSLLRLSGPARISKTLDRKSVV